MANTIYIKSSQTGSSAPHATDDLKVGEIAVNTNDNKLFLGSKSGGNVGDATTSVKWVGAEIEDTDSLGTSDVKLSTQGNIKAYVDGNALLDSECTSLADVKALNQSVVSGATPTFTTTNFTDASNKRLMTDAQETLLDTVETNADVTDTANVTSAGALMDSEVTNLAIVKALAIGIGDGNFLTANDAVSDNDFLRIDGTEVEGRNTAEVRSDIGAGTSDISMDGSTADGIVTYGGSDNIDVESVWTIASNILTAINSSTGHPKIAMTTNGGDNGPQIVFNSKVTGADDALLGNFSFYGDDDGGNGDQLYASMHAKIKDASAGTERGSLEFLVAEFDGTCTTSGLTIHGAAADGEIDVDIGAGSGSTTTIAGNLTVNGTTTTINSTTLDVDDLNITVAKGAADSSAANDAGLTVDGADATMLYKHAGTQWEFNKEVNCTAGFVGPISIGGHKFNDIDVGSEFEDEDDHLMSSGAIKEKIESYGYGTGDITGVSAGVGLSGGATSGSATLTVDFSEFSDVTPVNGDKLATLDSDGSTEQLTTVAALATLFAGTNLTASNSVISVDDAFLKNDASDTTTGTITAGGFTTTGSITLAGHAVADIDVTSEASEADDHLMTSLAIKNFIEDYGYGTGDITGVTLAGDSGSASDTSANVDLTIAGGTGITTSASSTTVTATIDAAQTGITSLLATDIKIGEDDQTKIDFETADTINFYAGNENQLVLTNGYLTPSSNAIVDLGTDALEFKDLYIDGTAYIDTLSGCVVDGGSY